MREELELKLERVERDQKRTIQNYCNAIGCSNCPLYEDGESCHATRNNEIMWKLEDQLHNLKPQTNE